MMMMDDDGRAASGCGAGSCTWPVAISFQIFCHFKKAGAMVLSVFGGVCIRSGWVDVWIVSCDWLGWCVLCMGCWRCLWCMDV